MSALAYYLEDEGIPTVAISLVRVHSEKVANPRSLWVPFELGRPLGPPGDAEFQTGVLTTALRLLESSSGPVMLEDFPRDDPTAVELPDWRPPFALTPPAVDLADRSALEAALAREMRIVEPFHERFVARMGRTTIGLSGLPVADCAAAVAAALAGTPIPGPDPSVHPVQALRWAVDDLKAYTLEAMSAEPAVPASRQMQAWFWDRTLLARAIIQLRKQLLASADQKSQGVGRMNMVPGAQVARLGL